MTYKIYFYITWITALISLFYALAFQGILADETGKDGIGFLTGGLDNHAILWTLLFILLALLISRLVLDVKNKNSIKQEVY